MKTYKIAVEWSVYSTVEVEAESLEDAILKVEDSDFPLPTDSDYIDNSFIVNRQVTDTFSNYDI